MFAITSCIKLLHQNRTLWLDTNTISIFICQVKLWLISSGMSVEGKIANFNFISIASTDCLFSLVWQNNQNHARFLHRTSKFMTELLSVFDLIKINKIIQNMKRLLIWNKLKLIHYKSCSSDARVVYNGVRFSSVFIFSMASISNKTPAQRILNMKFSMAKISKWNFLQRQKSQHFTLKIYKWIALKLYKNTFEFYCRKI